MPNFFKYRSFTYFIYSNEHPPPHVHVSRGGDILKINFEDMSGGQWVDSEVTRGHFKTSEIGRLEDIARNYRKGMLKKWHNFLSRGIKPKCERIYGIKKKIQKGS